MKSEIAGTLVEWDENKNQQNIKKHGISFRLPHWYLPMRSGLNTLISCTARMKKDTWFWDAFREYCMLFIP